MDVKEVALGTEGNLIIKLVEGKLVFEAAHNHASGKVALVIEEDAGYFLDKLAELIPGAWDDAAIAVAKSVIKSL